MNQLLKQTHVVGVSEDHIRSMRKTKAFDFSHAYSAIQVLLLRNPGKSIYCFFKKENNGLPSLCCILTPSGQSPPSLCMNKEINARSGIVPFDTLRLRWAPLTKALEYDRMFHLIHDTDVTTTNTISDADDNFYSLEKYDLHLPDIGSSVGMSKKISKVSFLVTRSDDTIVSVEYDKESCGSIDEFVSRATKIYNLGDTVTARNGLRRNLKEAMKSKRTRLMSRADLLAKKSGFDSIKSYLNFSDNFIKAKIFPIEYTSSPDSAINASYGDADSSLIVTDFDSLNPFSMTLGGTATLDSVKLDATGGNSAHVLFLMLLLVELLSRLRRLDMLSRDENDLKRLIPFKRLVYFAEGQGYRFEERVKPLCFHSAVLSMRKRVGRCPLDLSDFICNFGLFDYNVLTPINLFHCAKILRLDPNNHNGLQLVRDDGSYQNIHPSVLPTLTSSLSLPSLIKKLLFSPSHQVTLPPGAREGDESKDFVPLEDIRSDCMKQAIMSLPDKVLSPSGKTRVGRSFPNHEIMFHEMNGYINSNVRSIIIKKTPKQTDPHEHAMTAKTVMVATAMIEGSSRSHAVVIDGTKGRRGTIYDPSEGFGEVQRSTAGLKKLGIKSFSQAYEIQRNDISDKRRAKLQRDTGLPFFSA